MRIFGIFSLLTLLLLTFVLPAQAEGEKTPIESYCGIAVGEEQQAKEIQGDIPWSLKLIFADKVTRNYLSDVEVTVADENGEQLLQNLCEGAWIVMALPKGTYKVSANYNEDIQEKTISVPGGDLKTEYFFW